MAINIDAIRRKVEQLKNSSFNRTWYPKDMGVYYVRVVPWPDELLEEGLPFIERFMYRLDREQFFAPRQFDKPDPINEMISKLQRSKKPEDKELAKRLYPKLHGFIAIVVRGEEDKGVQLWDVNKFIYERLNGFFLDAEIDEDWTDPVKGYDLKIEVSASGKFFNNKPVKDVLVTVSRKSTPLSTDKELMKKWLANMPDINEYFPPKSEAEITKVLDRWLATGSTEDVTSDGTARGANASEALDALADEVKEPAKKTKKKVVTPDPDEDDVDLGEKVKDNLDAAFDDLVG